MESPQLIWNGPAAASQTVALAHGAGQPMDAPFMTAVAEGLGARGLRVARFNFPYMAAARATGRRKPPDREPVLRECSRRVVEELGPAQLIIGGKSMGGRMATLVADACGVRGVVALGYPFHPPGSPDRLRTAHLETIVTPTLICQGTRDPFGGEDEVAGYRLAPAIRVRWIPDGDHGFRPRLRSGRTEAANIALAVDEVSRFAEEVLPAAG